MSNKIFTWCAIGMGCAVAYHAAGAFGFLTSDTTPVWRHLLFVVIDALGIWYFLRRPVIVLPVFALLFAQQIYSHGGRVLRWWTVEHRVDTISIITLTGLTIACVALVIDARDRSPRVRRLVCPFPARNDS
jgi:hypothetical protein